MVISALTPKSKASWALIHLRVDFVYCVVESTSIQPRGPHRCEKSKTNELPCLQCNLFHK